MMVLGQPSRSCPAAAAAAAAAEGRIIECQSCDLWDVSGDKRYDTCWDAISRGAHGVVLVFNPDEEGQEQELVEWSVMPGRTFSAVHA